jgi:hypothetical protein
MIGAEQALHCTATKIETLSNQITQALVNQGPALLAEVDGFTARQKLMKHRIKPIRHSAEQPDKSLCFSRTKSSTTRGASKRVMASALPKLYSIRKKTFEAELLGSPEHGLTTIEIQGLHSE